MKLNFYMKSLTTILGMVILSVHAEEGDKTITKGNRNTEYLTNGKSLTLTESGIINIPQIIGQEKSRALVIIDGNNIINNGLIGSAASAANTLENLGPLSGSITNNGRITSSYNTAILNMGTINGSIINGNSGTIEGNAGIVTTSGVGLVALIKGDISNAGVITGRTTQGISNYSATIDGKIINTDTGTISGYLTGIANIFGGTITGGIVNAGVVIGGNFGIANNATLTGGIVNSGSISGIDGIANTVTLAGGIFNSGTIKGYSDTANSHGIANSGTLTGGIVNSGTIKGYSDTANSYGIANSGTLNDGIVNSGTITGRNYAIYNTGSLTGGIVNSGTLSSENYAIYNTGTLDGGVLNYGVLDGAVSLGSADLNIGSGGNARITGVLTSNAAVNIDGDFTAEAGASVNTLNVNAPAALSIGSGLTWTANNTVVNKGTLSVNGMLDSSVELNEGTLEGTGVVGSTTNRGGTISPGGDNAIGTLTIDGDYIGNSGTLNLATVLSGDNTLTDKLAITGSASGTTYVNIANQNGSGSKTLEGIEVISTGNSTNNAFVQNKRLVAGSYEYFLTKGNALQTSGSLNNWYLTSYLISEAPFRSASGNLIKVYRPEIASYTSNLQAANTLFSLNLHDRVGETAYIDPITGEKKVTSMWVRNEGGRNAFSMSDKQNKTTANRYVLQVGGDVAQWSRNGEDSYRVGLMGGYASRHNNTRNNLTGYNSKGSVEGYSAGLYGTWLQDEKNELGAYVDSWAQYNWFDNAVKGDELSEESYKSKGITASVETGYTFNAHNWTSTEGMTNSINIQPQAQ